jgi:hypothetical protein
MNDLRGRFCGGGAPCRMMGPFQVVGGSRLAGHRKEGRLLPKGALR